MNEKTGETQITDNLPIQEDLDDYGVWGIEAKDDRDFETIAAGMGMPQEYIDYCLARTQELRLRSGEIIRQTRPVAGVVDGKVGRMYEVDPKILAELKTRKELTKTEKYKRAAVKKCDCGKRMKIQAVER